MEKTQVALTDSQRESLKALIINGECGVYMSRVKVEPQKLELVAPSVADLSNAELVKKFFEAMEKIPSLKDYLITKPGTLHVANIKDIPDEKGTPLAEILRRGLNAKS
jgi:hypothetical protein